MAKLKPKIITYDEEHTLEKKIQVAQNIERKLIFYDFEVYENARYWCVTFIDYDTKEITFIENDVQKIRAFYESHKEDIFLGYNSSEYDYWIFQALILGLNVFKVNHEMFAKGKRGYASIGRKKPVKLINYDLLVKDKSLKQLEGFMGSRIKESSVPFDFKGVLTKEQKEEIKEYNIHDVQETIKVFEVKRKDYNAHYGLITDFALDPEKMNTTPAQITGEITGAIKQHTQDDEFNVSFPDTLRLSDEFQYIKEWYDKPENKSYKKSLKSKSNQHARTLETLVCNVPTVFGYGGVHGALNNYIGKGLIVSYDVASLYPALMIEYDYLSRKLKDKKIYRDIRDKRIELKKIKDPRQAPLKLVLNSFYGILKYRNNAGFDPLMSNNVCLAGQLLLLDSIDKIKHLFDDKTYMFNLNTDGNFLMVENEEKLNQIKSILQEWQERTRLELEFDEYERIYQKDVNNYIVIPKGDLYNEKGEPLFKTKGAYVKELSPIDYDLAVINRALVRYFTEDIPLRETIESTTDLIDFQKIVKMTSLYDYTSLGDSVADTPIREKVNRVFATKDKNAKGFYKWKGNKPEKVANTPDRCRIVNDDIVGVKIPLWLDIEYYVQLAEKRLQDFFEKDEPKVNELPMKLFDCYSNANSWYEFFELAKEQNILNKSTEIYIKADCLSQFAKSKKILEFIPFVKSLMGKKSMMVSQLNKKVEKGEFTQEIVDIIKKHSVPNKTGKSLSEFDYKSMLMDIWKMIPNESIHPSVIMKSQIELFDKVRYIDDTLDDDYYFILNWHNNISPFVVTYNIRTGVIENYKVDKKAFNILPLEDADIIRINSKSVDYYTKIVGKTDDGINIFEKDMSKSFNRIDSYDILYRDYSKATTQDERKDLQEQE